MKAFIYLFLFSLLLHPGVILIAADMKDLAKWSGKILIGSEVEINQREAVSLVSDFTLEEVDAQMLTEDSLNNYLLSKTNWFDLKKRMPELAEQLSKGLILEEKILSPESYGAAEIIKDKALVLPDLTEVANRLKESSQSNKDKEKGLLLDSTGEKIRDSLILPAANDWITLNERWRALSLEIKSEAVEISFLPKKFLSEFLFEAMDDYYELSFKESSVFFENKEASQDLPKIMEIRDVEPFNNLKAFFKDIRYLVGRIGKTSVLNQPLNSEFISLSNSFSFHYHLSISWEFLEKKRWDHKALEELLLRMQLFIGLKRKLAGFDQLWLTGQNDQALRFGKRQKNRFEFREHYDSPENEISFFLELISQGPKKAFNILQTECSSMLTSLGNKDFYEAQSHWLSSALYFGLERKSPSVLKEWIFRALILETPLISPWLSEIRLKSTKAKLFKVLNSNPNFSKFQNWYALRSEGEMPTPEEKDRSFLRSEVKQTLVLQFLFDNYQEQAVKLWKELNKLEDYIDLIPMLKRKIDSFRSISKEKRVKFILEGIETGDGYAYYLLAKSDIAEKEKFTFLKNAVLNNVKTAIEVISEMNAWEQVGFSDEQLIQIFKDGAYNLDDRIIDLFKTNRFLVLHTLIQGLEVVDARFFSSYVKVFSQIVLTEREKAYVAKKLFESDNIELAKMIFDELLYDFNKGYLREYLLRPSPLRERILLEVPYHRFRSEAVFDSFFEAVIKGDFSLLPSLIFSSGRGVEAWQELISEGLNSGNEVLMRFLIKLPELPVEVEQDMIQTILKNKFKDSIVFLDKLVETNIVDESLFWRFIEDRIREHDEKAILLSVELIGQDRKIFDLLMKEIAFSSELRRLLREFINFKVYPELIPEIRKNLKDYERSKVSCRESAA